MSILIFSFRIKSTEFNFITDATNLKKDDKDYFFKLRIFFALNTKLMDELFHYFCQFKAIPVI